MKTRRGTVTKTVEPKAPDPAPGLEEETLEPEPKRTRRSTAKAAAVPPSPDKKKAPPPKPQTAEKKPEPEKPVRKAPAPREPPPPAPSAGVRTRRGATTRANVQPEEAISVEAITGGDMEEEAVCSAPEPSAPPPVASRAAKRKSSALNPAVVPAPAPSLASQVRIEVESPRKTAPPPPAPRAPAPPPPAPTAPKLQAQLAPEAAAPPPEPEEAVEPTPAPPPKPPPPLQPERRYHGTAREGGNSGGPLRPVIYEEKAGRGSRLVVEAPQMGVDRPFIETPLPGTADEVESYPCRHCPDKVFLTSYGLEKHTQTLHPQHIDSVKEEIVRIQEEWKRREAEREKQKERLTLAKLRQEALAAAAAREQMASMAAAAHPGIDEQVPSYAPKAMPGRISSELPSSLRGEDAMHGAPQGGNFESCRICGLLINADHPTAMENHMRAHKKNDQLRNQLLQTVGPEFVARVTCHECQLVFTDERKLIAHAEAMHVRRRKYVCKWCGHVCLTMTDLNNHKADVHGMAVSRSRDPDTRRNRQMASLTKGRGMPPPLGVQSAASRRATALAEAHRGGGGSSSSPRVLTSVEELPCRTTCDICGLVMVKPSLLIRHMMRVHNKTNFTATVETKGMPSFRITVEQGKLSWTCCGEAYSDRAQFVYHRRMNHQPKLTGGGGMYGNQRPWQVERGTGGGHGGHGGGQPAQTSQPIDPQPQVPSTEGVQPGQTITGEDGQQYMVMLVDAEGNATGGDGGQIVLTPDQLQELGITASEGENVILMVDDGSGGAVGEPEVEPQPPPPPLQPEPEPEPEPQPQTGLLELPPDAAALAGLEEGSSIMLVDENGKPMDIPEGYQIRLTEDGEVELVPMEATDAKPLPTSGETKPGIILSTAPEAHQATDSYHEFLNTEGAATSQP